jgi:hypothetical protein
MSGLREFTDTEKLMALKRALNVLKQFRYQSDIEFTQRDALAIESIILELKENIKCTGIHN